jgi:glycosyltransferase involved in cell wall biosynthesis
VANDHGIISQHYQNAPSTLAAARFTIRAFYPFADQRVAVSEGVANDLAAISGLSRSRIHVIANPIKPPPERIEVGDEIERLWGKNGARILSVGSLKAEKDYELLLNAFSRLARRIEARLIILGEGEQRGELEAQARRLGIFDRVVMPGFRPDPWPFYASAHLLTLSSTTEGFGNVLVEAMAVGTPVVSTDCAGPREILRDGTLGRLVAGGNVDALAEAMELTLAEAPDREQLKARAWDFRPECALDQYIELMVGR